MNWTRPNDLRAQVQKLWDAASARGARGVNRHSATARVESPTSTEMTTVSTMCALDRRIARAEHCRIDMRSFAHRVFGRTRCRSVWVDRIEDAFAMIGKRAKPAFQTLLESTRARQPRCCLAVKCPCAAWS